MRRFISYLAFAFTLAVMVGCVKTDDITSDHQGMVTLKLSNNTLITTRAATSDDEKALNEFWIDKVQCFFTTDGSTIVYASDLITIADEDGSADLNLIIPSSAMTTLFSGTGTPKIYVVANVGTKIEAETIDAVKEQAITLEAYTADAAASAQSKFVMDSALTSITKSDNSIGTSDGKAIDLIRAAAKIQVQVNINKIITVGEGDAAQTWTPVLDNIEMTYNRSVTSSKLNATADAATARASYTQKSESADFTFAGTDAGSTATAYTLTQKVPFYSYPSSWANTENTEDPKDIEAYISLIIPWSKDNGKSYLTYSYQIPVNFDGKQLLRNHLYQLNVDVGVLGTLEGDVALTPSYVVVDWGTGAINAALSSPRYLVVDKNKLEIYNQSTVSVGYNSSHAVTATIDRIEFNSYRLANTRTITITSNSTTINPTSNKITVTDQFTDYKIPTAQTASLAEGRGTLDFSHAVPTNYVPHTIYVTLRHTDNASFSQQIEIVQYPPIYITSMLSQYPVFVNGNSAPNEGNENVSVGGVGAGSITARDNISGNDDTTNQNRNQYNIYVTALPSTSTYQIGDPRAVTGSQLSNVNALDNYRATRTDAPYVIAPAFKIASSYGKTVTMSYQGAINRCATYQENGYPAGRWRIPTRAEIEFIQQRVLNEDIPSMFNGIEGSNNGRRYYTGYFAADGYVYWPGYGEGGVTDESSLATGFYTTTQLNSNNQSVRCVYDVWYWGDAQINNPNTFTIADN